MFDLFKKQSFINLDAWLKEVEKHGKTDVEIVVIANKNDLVEAGEIPEVTMRYVQEFESRTKLKVYLASAKSGKNVEATFLELTKTLIHKHQPQHLTDGEYAKPSDGSTTLFNTKEGSS